MFLQDVYFLCISYKNSKKIYVHTQLLQYFIENNDALYYVGSIIHNIYKILFKKLFLLVQYMQQPKNSLFSFQINVIFIDLLNYDK